MKMKSWVLLGFSLAALNGWSIDPIDDTLGYQVIECVVEPIIRKSDASGGKRAAVPLGQPVYSAAETPNWCGYACAYDLSAYSPGSVYYVQGDWKVPKILETPDHS